MKREYTIYGLKINGANEFFYIGVTYNAIEYRMSMHLSSVRCGTDTNEKKSEAIKNCNFKISAHCIYKFIGTKEDALKLEWEYISKYLNDGHPLTNFIPEFKSTKVARIGSDIHKQLKIYSAESGINMTRIIEQAVINFMKEFSAEWLRDAPRKQKQVG